MYPRDGSDDCWLTPPVLRMGDGMALYDGPDSTVRSCLSVILPVLLPRSGCASGVSGGCSTWWVTLGEASPSCAEDSESEESASTTVGPRRDASTSPGRGLSGTVVYITSGSGIGVRGVLASSFDDGVEGSGGCGDWSGPSSESRPESELPLPVLLPALSLPELSSLSLPELSSDEETPPVSVDSSPALKAEAVDKSRDDGGDRCRRAKLWVANPERVSRRFFAFLDFFVDATRSNHKLKVSVPRGLSGLVGSRSSCVWSNGSVARWQLARRSSYTPMHSSGVNLSSSQASRYKACNEWCMYAPM